MYKASTSCHATTSTPKASARRRCACAAAPHNISTIERSSSAPILVSDASIADLERHFKKCSPSKSSLRTSTSSNCSRRESPRVCIKKESPSCIQESPRACIKEESPRVCIKKEPLSRCVNTSAPASADKSEGVEELYFNNEAKKSGASSPRGHCVNECPETREMKPVCSGIMKKIEKQVMNRSCGGIVKDSSGMCSLVDSASATCDASVRAQYYQNKLLSTLQILQNKEETIRVQAQSLAVAEARITALSDRAFDLKRELDRKTKEYQHLLKSVDCCKVEKNDVCIVTDKQMEDQSDIVSTLQNNLEVIEELYRECFYETAKQESLIDMLRSSYLDVRLMERQKADQIGRLQSVIDTQKWSLDRCQDIALEVDSLKMEISNFLHSSTSTNNDSGMWERSEESFASAPGVQDVHDDLRDVTELLLRLRDLLASGCTCGLQEENMRLKQEIETLDIRIGEMRARICELECTLVGKTSADSKYRAEIEAKEKELSCIRQQLSTLEEGSRDQSITCESLTMKLRHLEVLLDEKKTEMADLQQQNDAQAKTIKELQEELVKADQLIGENCKMRSEVSYLSGQVSLWRDQLADSQRRVRALDVELARCREHCAHIDACYREKAGSVAELQAQLEEAHARGAALCGEARRAVCAVRHWVRRMRDKHRQQDNLIKEKEALLMAFQKDLEERQSESQRTSASENTPTCSKCLSSRNQRSFCSKAGERQQCCGPSTSEIPSCSSTPSPTVPIRVLRKKSCANKEPVRRDASVDPGSATPASSSAPPYCAHRDARHVQLRQHRDLRDVSPTEELLSRMEQLTEAMADGHRRWRRPRDAR